MGTKTGLYLNDKTAATINAYGADNLSGTIGTIIDRYARITAEDTPELTEGEWSAICDALNGCGALMGSGGQDPAGMIWASIADSKPDGLDEKWGIDCDDLAKKLKDLPLAGRIAAWDVAARFWASPNLNTIDTRDLLLEAGAKIKD